MTSDDRDPLDALLEEFTTAVRDGQTADVEDWARRHPDFAEQIRELFPTILAIEGLREDTARSDSGTRVGIGMIDRLGDFRIIAEIGRGGMGVVYEAEQESLGRRVAVKVLPPLRDPKRIRRFEREARTAARLHHTNIVPIFGVGEHEGWHYYVMQVIRGVGLDAVLRTLRDSSASTATTGERAGLVPQDAVRMLRSGAFQVSARSSSTDRASASTESGPPPPADAATPDPSRPDPGPPSHARAPFWRSVAEIGRQVADALAYAHGQGVLHRDVKPGNLLLDAQGVVWVTDFGLAKAVGHEGLTLSGDLVGTLQYMAPEQLHGRYDARTDVYGLGLTLYELLTLQPAFADGDRGGLIKKIEQGHPTPPSQIRSGLPHDLETIVLKAVQHDPRHRYQTAAELADDLQRFLEDRPIRARRATAVEQLWRWCRRNRAVASLAGVALIATVGAAVAGWTGYVSTTRALDDVRREAARASSNLDLALQAFEDVFDQVAGADRIEIIVDETGDETSYEWYSQETVSGKDAAILERLLAFYDRFAEQNAGSVDLRQDTAKAYRRVGFLLLQLRRIEDARSAYGRALDLLRGLAVGSEAQSVSIAAVHNDIGRVEMESVEPQAARAEFEAALALLEGKESRSARFETARAHEYLGVLSFSRRRLPFERFGPRGDRRPPPVPEDRGRPPRPQGGRRDPNGAPWIDAARHFQRAYDLNRALADEQPDNPAFQLATARCGRYVATALSPERPMPGALAAGRFERAAIVTETVERLRRLHVRYPDIDAYASELARTLLEFAERMRRTEPGRDPGGQFSATAIGFIEEAGQLAEALYAASPGISDHARLLADALDASVQIRVRGGAGADSAADRTESIAVLRRAIEVRPTQGSPRDVLRAVEDRITLGELLMRNGDRESAQEQVDLVMGALEALPGDSTSDADRERERESFLDVLRGRWTVPGILEIARLQVLSGDIDGGMRNVDRLLTVIGAVLGEDESAAGSQAPRERSRSIRFLRRPFEPLLRALRDQGREDRADELDARLRETNGR